MSLTLSAPTTMTLSAEGVALTVGVGIPESLPLTTLGDMLFRSSLGNARLPIGTAGQVLTVAGGIPAWATVSFTLDPITPIDGSLTILGDVDITGTLKTDFIETKTAGALTVKSTVADSGSAVAHVLDTSNSLITSGAKLLSVSNAGVEKVSIEANGRIRTAHDLHLPSGELFINAAQGIAEELSGFRVFYVGNALSPTRVDGPMDDGASAVAVTLSSRAAYTTPGAKLVSVINHLIGGPVEKFAVDYAGRLMLSVLTDVTRGAASTAGRVIFNSNDGNLNIDDGMDWILPDGTVT